MREVKEGKEGGERKGKRKGRRERKGEERTMMTQERKEK